ncbi:MAG: hypothetical protein GXP25_03230 [Planctomycetes bacterium]|nr:hypothetical protein [Planctomycetota bacterium]
MAYERPRIRVVELAAEEVLAKGCKTFTLTAPGQFSPPCWFAMCAQQGS